MLILNGVPISIIDGKMGFAGDFKSVYDYTTDETITRYQKK